MSDERQLLRVEHLAVFLNASERLPDEVNTALPRRRPVYTMFAAAAVIGIGGLGIAKLTSPPQPSQQVLAQAARPNRVATRALVETVPVSAPTDRQHRTVSQNIVNDGEVKPSGSDRQTSEPVSVVVQDRAEQPVSAARIRDRGLMPSSSEVSSRRQQSVSEEEPAAIEPYRNGTMAKRLTGERLRLALIEDRRLTKKMNEATLHQLRAEQPNDQRNAERP
jgi:hypothetical protein